MKAYGIVDACLGSANEREGPQEKIDYIADIFAKTGKRVSKSTATCP